MRSCAGEVFGSAGWQFSLAFDLVKNKDKTLLFLSPLCNRYSAKMSTGENAAGSAAAAGSGSLGKKEPPKGYSNPALAALGLRTIRLPSRNWMIFWTVLSAGLGGIAYDKYQQKQIRKHWMQSFEHLGQEPAPSGFLPRKIRVYVSPPPSDVLDESLKVFRRYVKPLINASGIDFEVFTEERVGDIRAGVAEEIRNLRRQKLGLVKEEKEDSPSLSLRNNLGASMLRAPALQQSAKDEEDQTKSVSELYSPSSLLGIRKWKPVADPYVSEDSLVQSPSEAGGVICLGRGAFKEYMLGVHEGLLGALDPPAEVVETKQSELEAPKVEELNETAKEEDSSEKTTEPTPTTDEEDEEKKRPAVPKPYILPKDYADAAVAPELDLSKPLLDDKGVPVFFQQPILVLRSYHLLGFLRTPEKIFRFYTKRSQATEYASKTATLISKSTRPLTLDDSSQASDEEADWPSKWVEQAHEKDNDWVRQFSFDERVISNMYIYDEKK
ncbi:unnamed protein product [Kuraishia capsulata CBS 1993]|uniref:Mitochondrial import inner membrane translocase subunit TIM54 n=1 Tax=Kuraishia capsulata CBS 1993 TaxID=1382522 RepID=W6MWG1_9ASCO|nr:uncharacterized protein KUCA_T00003363001 [Kuraishia capsulata CBS 1993]CDK27385.1 unnamed protein product [Kuraishia capsulata CBS 1993]